MGAGCVLPPAPVLDCWPPAPSRLLCRGGSWPCRPIACRGRGGEGRAGDQRGGVANSTSGAPRPRTAGWTADRRGGGGVSGSED